MNHPLLGTEEGSPRREEIYRAAVSLFRDKGYHATSMRDIGRSVGVQTSTLYHYFPSKHALLSSIMASFLTDLLRMVRDGLANEHDPVSALRKAVVLHVTFHGVRRLEAVVTDTEVRALKGPDRARVLSLRDDYETLFRGLLGDVQAAGCLRPVHIPVAVRALLGMATSVVMWYRPEGPISLQEIAREHADLALSGVVRSPEANARS